MFLWFIATFTAYFVKGLCGFANTLIFTTILSFGATNASISPVDLLQGYPANLILTWKNRRSLDPKVFLPLSILVLAGSIPGAFILRDVDAASIKLVFGVVVIAMGMGLFTGIKCCGHMNDEIVRKNTTVLLILSGIALVLKNL